MWKMLITTIGLAISAYSAATNSSPENLYPKYHRLESSRQREVQEYRSKAEVRGKHGQSSRLIKKK